MPKVSVIIPIYNVEKYLKQCVDSVINQSLKDIEIILVDDGSTDSCPRICDDYAKQDKRIQVIHLPNDGLGKAYNAGIAAAKSDYIGFVESDDFAEYDMYENLYNIAVEMNADIVKSSWFNYWSVPEEKNITEKPFKHFPIKKVINAEQEPKLVMTQAAVWSAIYEKKFLNDYNIKFLETPGASYQDTSFAFKTTVAAKKIVLTSNAYIHYRQDNETSSVKSKEKVYVICDEVREIEKFLNEYPQIKKYIEPYKWYKQFRIYKWNLLRVAPEYKSEFANIFRNEFLQLVEKKELYNKFFEILSDKEKESFKVLINNSEDFISYINLQFDNREMKTKLKELKNQNKELREKIKELQKFKFNFLGFKISHRK